MTGASGGLGRKLLDSLLREFPMTHFVLLVHRAKIDVRKEDVGRVRLVSGSLADSTLLHEALLGVDTIVHVAAITHALDPELYKEVNTLGTKNLVTEGKRAGVSRILQVSTTALGGDCGAYGASKSSAEDIVRKSGIPFTIVRLGEMYGAGSGEGIDQLITSTGNMPFAPYVVNTYMAPVSVLDVIFAFTQTLCVPASNKTYILAGPEVLSFREVVIQVLAAKKKWAVPLPVSKSLLSLFVHTTRRVKSDQVERLYGKKDYNNTTSKNDLLFSPRTFRDGLVGVFGNDEHQ